MFMEAEARRGVALMEKERPGWAERINLNYFNMEWGTTCVLGQEFGSWLQGRAELKLGFNEAVAYGFNLPGDFLDEESLEVIHAMYKQLADTWVTLINELRGARVAAPTEPLRELALV